MDNIDFEYLINLSNQGFYRHIENKYGTSVMKILEYHDIDSYEVLNEANLVQLIDLFEKPDDENSTATLTNLKTEICSVSEGTFSVKFGTKSKLICLLKSARDIVKTKRLQVLIEKRNRKNGQQRSTFSSNDDNNNPIMVNTFEKHEKSIGESIDKLLIKIQGQLHGYVFSNLSKKNFEIIFEHGNDSLASTCSIQCVCGDRIKLYNKKEHFQISNLSKHLTLIKTFDISRIIHDNEELDKQPPQNINQSQSQSYSTNRENNRSDNSNGLNSVTFNDTPVPTKNSQSNSNRVMPEENRYVESAAASSKHRQTTTRMQPQDGETNSSIDIVPSTNKKKQILNNQPRQTTNSLSHQYRAKSLHKQDLNSTNSSQSKKRKYDDEDEDYHHKSTSRNTRKTTTEQENSFDEISSSAILSTFLKTIQLNINRTANNYRYDQSVLRFAACLLILAGAYVYEFLRLNFKFLLPSIQTVNRIYKQNPYTEAQFRFDEATNYLNSIDCQYVFMSEDCSGIIPRVEYDSTFDCFNGFVTPIINGKPIENAFRCKSFEKFQDLFKNHSRSNLVNVHLLQPICTSICAKPSATVLSAYGTDSKLSSIDIIKRWILIFSELRSRNVYVLGFSTDGDPKCLRAMRLASNFFVRNQTINIDNDNLSFTIQIPSNWSSWYFLNPNQLFLFLQDGIHLCNKLRNRLLSRNVYLHMGRYKVSAQHLHQLIESSNKIDTNLSKSDLLLKDKQNFSSCQKVCNGKVLDLLALNDDYNGTYAYLLLIHLLIKAYVDEGVSLTTRIFYAWIVVFFVRFWRIWLFKSKKTRRSFNESHRNFFITSNALYCIELNAHTLIFLSILIDQKLVPQSVADSIHLFSSQPCESIFRDARSLSGVYSTRINFTIKQFLERVNKLNALCQIKQYETTNDQDKIVFPIHHKIKRMNTQTEIQHINEFARFDSDHVEDVVLRAYELAQEIVESVGMDTNLLKQKLFDIEDSSKIAKHLLQLNSLSESEILVLDGRDYESDEEEDGFIAEQEGEEDDDEEQEDVNDAEIDVNDNADYDEDDNNNQSEDTCDENESQDNIYCGYESDEDQSTSTFENVRSTSYSGLRLVQSVPSVNVHKYFPVYIHKKKLFLHKSTAAWYMQEKQAHLPSDRLQRVQFKET